MLSHSVLNPSGRRPADINDAAALWCPCEYRCCLNEFPTMGVVLDDHRGRGPSSIYQATCRCLQPTARDSVLGAALCVVSNRELPNAIRERLAGSILNVISPRCGAGYQPGLMGNQKTNPKLELLVPRSSHPQCLVRTESDGGIWPRISGGCRTMDAANWILQCFIVMGFRFAWDVERSLGGRGRQD